MTLVSSPLKLNIDLTDKEFDRIYPYSVRKNSKVHWTPVKVAKAAARILVDRPGIKVLDAGSGAGKFCLVGAAMTNGVFTGVEQRKYLVEVSNFLFNKYGLSNSRAIHANILSVDFKQYDAFYFYNPFMENLRVEQCIDRTINLSTKNYETYIRYVHNQLNRLPNGTKIVTYCSNGLKIPLSYKKKQSFMDGLLDLWIKSSSDDKSCGLVDTRNKTIRERTGLRETHSLL